MLNRSANSFQFLFSTGPFGFVSDGASKCVVSNLLSDHDDVKLYLLSNDPSNTSKPKGCVYYKSIERQLKRALLPGNVLQILMKKNRGYTLWQGLEAAFVEYNRNLSDKIAAAEAKKILYRHPEIKLLMGYSSLSLQMGKLAKKTGRLYGMHCQWCHPNVQHNQLRLGYKAAGCELPKQSPNRIRKQLAEFELADIIWCPSEYVKKSLVENGIPENKIIVSYLGVDLERYGAGSSKKVMHNKFTILFVGNVGVQKGIHVLLAALVCSELESIQVILNGTPDDTVGQLINKYKNELDRKNISIRVDPGDPVRNYAEASVLVLPSVHDAFGIVVPEAMAAGLPIIVSNNAGASEIINDGMNGYVFTSENSKMLADVIGTLKNDVDLLYKFSEESKRISVNYSDHRQRIQTVEKLRYMTEIKTEQSEKK